MIPGCRRFRVGARLAAVIALASAPALADMTKDQCIDANGKGQELRREGKLSAAREQLRACANPSCPAMVRDDCTKRLDELERAQPAIVFDAKDGSGRDVSVVNVTVDGRLLAEKLDGTALPVDPGEHAFVFTVLGQAPVTQTFVLKEGDKERRERIVLGEGASPASLAAPTANGPTPAPVPANGSAYTEPASTGGGMGTPKILGLVASGVGVAGIAVGAVFGLLTASAISQQKSDCASATNCTHYAQAASDHSAWTTDSTVSTAAFIAGGALLAGGAILFFAAHRPSERPAAAGLFVAPSVGPGGGGMLLRGEF